MALTTASGVKVRRLNEGLYAVSVSDQSRRENFHLVGPGVDRSTGLGSTITVVWRIRLHPGTYRYRSDRHPAHARRFTVRA